MYVGEISCKDEDGLKQFVNDHEGSIFAEEDSQEMVMLCFRHSDMRISPEEWERWIVRYPCVRYTDRCMK